MMATAHTLVAGAIASKIGDPALALPITLASHFALDAIPHWDFGTNWRERTKLATGIFAIIDTVFGLAFSFIVFQNRASTELLITCLVLSVLPDWLEAPWYIWYANKDHHTPGKNASIIEQFSFRINKLANIVHSKASFPLGVISQIVTVIFFLLVLR